MTTWRSLRALGAGDRRLLAETALLMVRVRTGLLLGSYAGLRTRLAAMRPTGRAAPLSPDRAAWAVGALARRLPGMTCLVQSLVADTLLRRRGYHPELHIGVRVDHLDAGAGGATAVPDSGSVRRGVRKRGSGPVVPLDAHAWVECEGRIVAGEVDDLAAYSPLRPVRPPASAAHDPS
jgi:hypothetical protein